MAIQKSIRYRGRTEADGVNHMGHCNRLPADAGNVKCPYMLDGIEGDAVSMQWARRQMEIVNLALRRLMGDVHERVDAAVKNIFTLMAGIDDEVEKAFEKVADEEGGPSTIDIQAGQRAACRKCAETTTTWATFLAESGMSVREHCPED